jgi:hypothetical protein
VINRRWTHLILAAGLIGIISLGIVMVIATPAAP